MKFELLQELADLGYYNLSDNQKHVLIVAAIAATPIQAYATTTGNANLVTSRNILVNLGMLQVINNSLTLTEKGREALTNYNLIDTSGLPTEDANKILQGDDTTQGVEAISQ